MKYKTIIQVEAVQDFKDAKLWYKKAKVNGLSQRFTNAVKATISNLQTILPLTLSGIKISASPTQINSHTLFIFLLRIT